MNRCVMHKLTLQFTSGSINDTMDTTHQFTERITIPSTQRLIRRCVR